MPVRLKVRNIDALAQRLREQIAARPTIRINVVVVGPAASYAFVWEYGRVSIKPGPKTLWSTNYDGDRVVLTITAPHGFIRVHEQEFRKILRQEVGQLSRYMKGRSRGLSAYVDALELALDAAGARCLPLIVASAPKDKGDLAAGLRIRKVTDAKLRQGVASDSFSLRVRLPGRG